MENTAYTGFLFGMGGIFDGEKDIAIKYVLCNLIAHCTKKNTKSEIYSRYCVLTWVRIKNIMKRQIRKRSQSMLKEFKEFAFKGNVVDLAVAVIMGGAFGKIVTSLVNDVLMPLIGVILGGISFVDLKLTVAQSEILYGNFIQSIVDFLIIAICIFLMVKAMNATKKKEAVVEEVKEPAKSAEVLLLEEIRDLLKK